MSGGGVFWLASYPKSGNTWVRIVLSSLQNAGRQPDLAVPGVLCPHSAELAWIEEALYLSLEDMTGQELAAMRAEASLIHGRMVPGPAFLKVHDAYDAGLFPAAATAGTILIVRDPRDIASSWADHLGRSLDDTIARMSWADFTLARPGGYWHRQVQQRLGSWSLNVRSWLDQAPGPKLLLRFEDMLMRPAESFAAFARFAGLHLSGTLLRDTVQATTFHALKTAETVSGFSERRPYQKAFFRQGRAGAWRASLTPEQAGQIWRDHGRVMARLGYREDGTLDSPSGTGSGG